VLVVVRCGRKHCGGGKLVSVGLYELRHMWIHNTSLHRNTFYKKGRISMRTDSSTWKFYLLAVFCTCILPFPVEFPDLSSGRRSKFSRAI